jgi:hypothetical protein
MTGNLPSRTVVVSSIGSAAARLGGRVPAAPARAVMVRKRRRLCTIDIGILPCLYYSRLQLAFELIKETPIRAVGDDLLRIRLDQAQRR